MALAQHRWRFFFIALPFAVGGVLIAASPQPRPTFTCHARLEAAALDHVARCDRGTHVRVSSADYVLGHHPLFLIDGRVGAKREKWVSLAEDRRPWAELSWGTPRRLSRIVLHHAGVLESASLNTRDFSIRARAAGGWSTVATVRGNRQAVTQHDFAPIAVTAVRLDVERGTDEGDARARIYEIEAFGP